MNCRSMSGSAASFSASSDRLVAMIRELSSVALTSDSRVRSFPSQPKRKLSAALNRVGVVDRKSTRLNSSHSQISYAVLCLTKNNLLTGLVEAEIVDDDGRQRRLTDEDSSNFAGLIVSAGT